MNWKRCLIAIIAAGVVVNVFDMVVHGWLFQQMFYSKLKELFRPEAEMNLPMIIFGDFVGAAVLVWFYNRVLASFGPGAVAGAKFGAYAGVFAGFPTFIFMHLTIRGYPYSLAWAMTIYAVVWCTVAGIVAGLIYEKVN
ncbi:MAG: hypothetical protein FJW39_15750 [Acidobacteria bacterium]|nr:hypothetical protein [Acidobacteriota bacterium]